jgi:hypothetical protein
VYVACNDFTEWRCLSLLLAFAPGTGTPEIGGMSTRQVGYIYINIYDSSSVRNVLYTVALSLLPHIYYAFSVSNILLFIYLT